MMKQAETVAAREHSDFLQRAAKTMIAGNMAGTRALILQNAEKFGTNPRTLAQRVVETAQELTIPYSPLDHGPTTSMQDREQIAKSFAGAMPQRVAETAKLQQRSVLEQGLGIPGAGRISPKEMSKAAMVDRILQMSPNMSRQEAQLVVEKQMDPRGQRF